MFKLFLAGIGGFVGSILRYSVGSLLFDVSRRFDFPCGTLVVNFAGCLAIGLLSHLAETRGVFSAETRVLVFVGLLGGFTTFSAFSVESLVLMLRGEWLLALGHTLAHVVGALAFAALGFRLASPLLGR